MYSEWNLMNAHGGGDVPKVADFLGVSSKSDHQSQSDLVSYNEIQGNENDHHYLFSNNSLVPLPLQETLGNNSATTPSSYEFQESSSNMQSLTLSMGSGSKGLTSETGVENSTNSSTNAIVEAAPRRTLDTFGQRTSIYRGVTR